VGGGGSQQLLGATIGSVAHQDIARLQEQMSKAFTHLLGADAHPGQPPQEQVVGTVQAPGVRPLVSARDMGGIDQEHPRRSPKLLVGAARSALKSHKSQSALESLRWCQAWPEMTLLVRPIKRLHALRSRKLVWLRT